MSTSGASPIHATPTGVGRTWLHPRQTAHKRWVQWWQNRLTPRDEITLTQRNVYILPTGAGFMLGVTLLILLIASINYQLNLGYLLTFVLLGNVVIGVFVCHNSLRGLQMRLSVRGHVFAGESQLIDIALLNTRATPRLAIGLSVYPQAPDTDWAYVDVPAKGSVTTQVQFQTTTRGWHSLPTLTAETRYPLGTFRVWTYWRPASKVLVFPRPELQPPALPLGQTSDEDGPPSHHPQGDQPEGVREYQRGDSMRLIVWRKAAKSDNWVSRDREQASQAPLWLDWRALHTLAPEARISRLTAWVLLADQNDIDYGLWLPGSAINPSQGAAHKLQCLEALALC
jgi:uncharacterized protein (DUF58 family)